MTSESANLEQLVSLVETARALTVDLATVFAGVEGSIYRAAQSLGDPPAARAALLEATTTLRQLRDVVWRLGSYHVALAEAALAMKATDPNSIAH